MNIIIDGKKYQPINNTENIYNIERNDNNIIPINQVSDMAESIKELNNDTIEMDTKTSAIDLKTRLSSIEMSYILQMDACVQLGVLPMSCLKFTRQKKRLAVSLNGMGRTEIKDILAPNREMQLNRPNKSFFSKLLSGKNE